MSLQAVVAVPPGSGFAPSAVDAATRAVIADGWSTGAADEPPPLPATTMLAVRAFWLEAT